MAERNDAATEVIKGALLEALDGMFHPVLLANFCADLAERVEAALDEHHLLVDADDKEG